MNGNKFEQELARLHKDLIAMGGAIEEAIELSINALINQDREISLSVIENDKAVNALARTIEGEAMKILLRRQPVAGDLRIISTALKMVTDMERIGDQARDICSIVLHLCEEEYQTKLIHIPQMAQTAKKMVNQCIDSFVRMDLNLAKNVIETDNEVDALFAKVRQSMIKLMRENSGYADQAIYLTMVAKYFEKIGDHAENIAEWVIFCKTGERKNIQLL
ncbi:MAG: phosphate signaling complex protein PhoU [Clostridiales bacterium]|jgi:phosphate transport system protein|nr:phosphate signaling complex protein PhoU [Clostridiales bacterium]